MKIVMMMFCCLAIAVTVQAQVYPTPYTPPTELERARRVDPSMFRDSDDFIYLDEVESDLFLTVVVGLSMSDAEKIIKAPPRSIRSVKDLQRLRISFEGMRIIHSNHKIKYIRVTNI